MLWVGLGVGWSRLAGSRPARPFTVPYKGSALLVVYLNLRSRVFFSRVQTKREEGHLIAG